MGTSHRQAPVRDLVGGCAPGWSSSSRCPTAMRWSLGNGGTTAFWDAAAPGWCASEALHLTYGEFSGKFAKATAAAPFLADPILVEAEPGDAPGTDCRRRRRRDRLGAQRDLDRRNGPCASGPRAPATLWSSSTPPRAPAGCRSTWRQADAYYFAPQKGFGADGGLWLALLSPAATARIGELDGAADRWQPGFLSLQTALENSRKEQTYNTPALATLLLLADQIEWMLSGGGLDWCVERTTASSGHLYGWAEASEFASPFVADPAKRSLVVGTIDFDESVDAAAMAATLRANGIVDVEPYRKLGRNQLRIGMFPAVEPADVEALTACIDWVIENAGGEAREGPGQGEDRRLRRRPAARELRGRPRPRDVRRGAGRGIGDYDAILIRSATKMTAELIERAERPEGDRPRRHRRRQRRHPGRHAPRHRRRQRAGIELGRRRRAHPGPRPWPSSATSRRRTAPWSPAAGTGPSTRALSCTARRSA